jgi:uncharacterized protein (DUF488 family)|tara:strand:- start:1315 stop:1797 length:483 start_codon:yes stop_codon:yes gene_type:complete
MLLSTIGYEGSTIDEFVETLIESGVEQLVDVRELPISRKKGFAKTKLSEALAEHGIRYYHLKSLGDPKPGREAARRGDFKEFKRIFSLHLATDEAQNSLSELENIAAKGRTCLMCFEREHLNCHRNMVVEAVGERREVSAVHLEVGKPVDVVRSKVRRAA